MLFPWSLPAGIVLATTDPAFTHPFSPFLARVPKQQL
jgi:hypothetical protein